MNRSTLVEWRNAAEKYRALLRGAKADSRFLRETYLYPTLVEMIHEANGHRVLDLGSGDGTLQKLIEGFEFFGCDLVLENLTQCYKSSVQDAECLALKDESFEIVLASLLLMWIPTLDRVCQEMYRILRPGGSVIISLVSPHFYRTGTIDEDGTFHLTRDLSEPFILKDLRIANEAGPVTYYYRPPHEYLNAFADTGFCHKRADEVYIDMDEYKAIFGSQGIDDIRRTGRIPLYNFYRFQRL